MLSCKTVVIAFISLWLISCAATHQQSVTSQSAEQKPAKQITEKKPVVVKNYPHWIDHPELQNHLSVTGSAGLQKWGGEQAQYLSAMDDAHTKLQQLFKQHREAVIKLKKQNKTYTSDENLNENIKTLLLQYAIVKAEWKDPKNGRLYLWLVLPGY